MWHLSDMNGKTLCHCSSYMVMTYTTFSTMVAVRSQRFGGFGWCPSLEQSRRPCAVSVSIPVARLSVCFGVSELLALTLVSKISITRLHHQLPHLLEMALTVEKLQRCRCLSFFLLLTTIPLSLIIAGGMMALLRRPLHTFTTSSNYQTGTSPLSSKTPTRTSLPPQRIEKQS